MKSKLLFATLFAALALVVTSTVSMAAPIVIKFSHVVAEN
ncbi:hypothetical protein EDC39_1273, partial [Geothermobacter ehrlichii]